MSDIPGDNSNDIQITTGIDNNLAQGVAQLTPALNSLAAQLVKLSQSATRNVDLSNTLSRSMGLNVTSAGKFKAELSKLINTQELSGRVMRQSKNDADQLAASYKRLSAAASGASVRSSAQFGLQQTSSHLSAMTANVKSFDKAIREVRIEHFATRMQQSGARSQQAAYNFTRNFTIPIIAGFRTAFFNFARLETETVRLTKLLGNNFASVDKSVSGMQASLQKNREYVAEIGLELDKITAKWGISRVLVQSLAGDFAELGIVSKTALSNLVMYTAEVEKLGNLDIGDSAEFVKTMYQTILRIRRDLKKSVDMSNEAVSEEVLGQLRGQIAMFNLIENQTTLSLKNIAQAFPEVTAAATSFGLSMTEAAAMIVPMVAAGFQVGASANSVKVSLQRMVAMTKQNTEILAGLNKELGPGFQIAAGVGMEAIQQLSDGYDLLKSKKGEQGVLELFSRLFGVRQGPRMETTVRQLASFQNSIESTTKKGILSLKEMEATASGIKLDTRSWENIITSQLEISVNNELNAAGLKSQNIQLKKYEDLSKLARLASLRGTDAEIKRSDAIRKGQIAAQDLLETQSADAGGPSGRDFISRTSTEVAKVLLAQAFDTKKLAESQLEFELKIAGQTSEVTYRRAKESLMGMGRTIVPIINSILTGLLPSLQKLQLWLSKNSEKFGKFFAVGALALAGIGPLKMLWSTLKILVGTLTGSFLKLYQLFQVTSSSFITFQELLMNPKLLRGSNPVIQYMDGFLIRKNKFDKALRKKSDYSGISIAAREVLEADAGASGAPVTKKIIKGIAGSTPITASTASLLISTAEPLSKGARDIADSAVSAQKAISEAIREGLSKGVGHLFTGPNVWEGPNYWVGPNYGAGGGIGGGKGKGGKDPDTSGMKVTKAKAASDVKNVDIPPLTIPNRINTLSTLTPSQFANETAVFKAFADQIKSEELAAAQEAVAAQNNNAVQAATTSPSKVPADVKNKVVKQVKKSTKKVGEAVATTVGDISKVAVETVSATGTNLSQTIATVAAETKDNISNSVAESTSAIPDSKPKRGRKRRTVDVPNPSTVTAPVSDAAAETAATVQTVAAETAATVQTVAAETAATVQTVAAETAATVQTVAAQNSSAIDTAASETAAAIKISAAETSAAITITDAQTAASQPVILPDSKPKRGRPRKIPTGGSVTAPVSNAAANAALIVADSKAGIVESVAETSSQVKRGGTRGRNYKKVMVSWADIIKMHDDAGVQIDEELRWLSQSTKTFEITEAKRNSIQKNIIETEKPFMRLTKKAPLREGFDSSFQTIGAIPGAKGRVRAAGSGASIAGLAFADSKEAQIQPFMDALAEELRVVGDKTKLTSFFDNQAKFRSTGRSSAAKVSSSFDVNAVTKRIAPVEDLFNLLATTEDDLVEAIQGIDIHQGNLEYNGDLVKRNFLEEVKSNKPKQKVKGLLSLALQRAGIDTRELTSQHIAMSQPMLIDDEALAKRDDGIIRKWVRSITRKSRDGKLVLKKSLFSKQELDYLAGVPDLSAFDLTERELKRLSNKLSKMGPSASLLQDYQRANQLPVTDVSRASDVINAPRGKDVANPKAGKDSGKRSASNARNIIAKAVYDEKEDIRIAAAAKESLANLSPDIPAETPTVVKPKRVRAPRISKSAKKAVEDISKKLPRSLSAAFNPQTFGDLINQQIQAVEDALTDVKGRFKLPAAKAGNISSRMRAKIVELTKNSKYAVNLPNLLATPISEISNDILKSIDGMGKGLVDDLSEGIKNKKTFLTPEGAGERQVATRGWKARIDSALDKIKKSKVTPTKAITDGLLSSVFRDAMSAAEKGLDAAGAAAAAATRTAAASVPGANQPTTPRVRTPRGKASIPLDPATMLPLNPDDQLQPMNVRAPKSVPVVQPALPTDDVAAQLAADKEAEEKRLLRNANARARNRAKKLAAEAAAAESAAKIADDKAVVEELRRVRRVNNRARKDLGASRVAQLTKVSAAQVAPPAVSLQQIIDSAKNPSYVDMSSVARTIDPLGTYADKKTVKQSLSSATNAFSTKVKSLTQSLSGIPEKISAKGKGVAAALSSVGSSISSKGKSLVSAIASNSAALTKRKVSSIGRSLLRTGEKIAMSPFSTGDINSPMGLSKRGYLDLINKDMTGVRGAKGLRTVLGSRGGGVFSGVSGSGMSRSEFESFGEGRVSQRALGKGLTANFNKEGIIESFTKAKKGAESVNISLAEGEKILRRRFLPAVNGLDNIFKSKSASRYFKLSTVGFGPGAISGFKAISKYVKDIPDSHVKATSAVEALKTKYTQLGKTAPGAIRRSAAYANSMLPVGDLLKGGVSKIASIFTTIISLVVKFAFTFLLIAPIVILVVGLLGKMKEAVGRNGPAFQNLKDALKNVKDAFYALAQPLITLFLGFAGVENKMLGLGTEGEKVAAVFYIFSKAIKSATEKFKAFAEGKTAQQMMTALGEITVRLVNRFILLGGAIKSLFSGDKEAAGKKFKAFLVSILYEIVAIVQIMTLALSKAFQGLGIVIEPVIKGLMSAFKAFFSWLISATIDASKSMGKSIAYGLGDMLLDGITLNNGSKVKDAYSGIINPIATTIGPKLGVPNTITDSSAPAASATDKGLLDSVTGISKTIADGISAGMGKGSEFLGGINEQIAAKFKELTGFDINTPMVNTIKGGLPEIQAAIKYVTAKSGDVATAGGESLGSKIAQGIKQKMQDVKKQFADLLYGGLDSQVDKVIDKYKSAIDKQKDIFLKAYDDQIAGLDALEEAESSLTDKMEYEINRREKIKNREQDSENYRRERKLAVYEGRIEDVRRLDQEEVRASDDHNKELTDLDLGENKRLSAEQREIVKAAINKEKRLQEKRFDSLIENYSELIDKIKEKGFTTQEEFQALMTAITAQTDATGTEMAKSFTESMLALPAAIAAVRDQSIPLFASIGTTAVGSIDDLINKAKTKFGLEADVNNPSSMLGAAWKLANGSSDAFAAAFDSTLYAKYVNEAFAEVEKVTKRLFTPGDPLNVAEAWENAGKSAFAKIQQELNRELMFDVIMKSFADFITKLKPIVDKVVAQTEKMKSALESVGKVSATPAPVLSEAWQKSTMAQMGQYATPTTGLTKEKAAAVAAQSELDRAKATAWIGTNYPLDVSGMLDALPSSGLTKSAQFLAQNWIKQYLGSGVNQTIGLAPLPMTFAGATRYFGGYMKKYNMGGMTAYNLGSYIDKPSNIGVPALLHGGEYVINHKAVNKFGKSNLAAINNLRHGGDLPGFALGGYVGNLMSNRMSGYAKGGSILRPRDKVRKINYSKPSDNAQGPDESTITEDGAVITAKGVQGVETNKNITGLQIFPSKNHGKYVIPNITIRSGRKYGTLLHPLDWEAIADNESGQDWRNNIGRVSENSEGVHVGPLNIKRDNWKAFGGLEFGDFSPGKIPSFKDQIKVAERMYTGWGNTDWSKKKRFLDGFASVYLGQVAFKPLSELRAYDKARGFEKGGYVGTADAMERRALGKSNAPEKSLFGRMKDNPMGYAKGFAKEFLRPKNLFPMIGAGVGGILGSILPGPGTVAGSIAGATIMGGVGEATEQAYGKFVSKTRESFNVGNIAKNALFSGVSDLAGAGIGKFILKPLKNYTKPILEAKFPGVGTYLEGQIARPLLNLFKQPGLKAFDPSTLNPDNIIDMVPKQSDLLPALGSPPKRLALPKGTGRTVVKFNGPDMEADAPNIRRAFFGEGGAFDKQVLELFDELDTITSGTHRSLRTPIRRDLLKAQLQIKGLIPKLTQSPEESYAYNKMIDEILGVGNNYTGTASAGYKEMLESLDLSAMIDNPFFSPVDDIASNVPSQKPPISRSSDPREILQSSEVSEFQALMRKNASQLAEIMRTKGMEELSLMASSRGISSEKSGWLSEYIELLLPMRNQPLDLIREFGPESPWKTAKNLQNIFAMKIAEQMRLSPKQLGPGGLSGGALVPYKPFQPGSLNLNELTLQSSANDPVFAGARTFEIPGFNIGNKTFSFGHDMGVQFGSVDRAVKNIDSNPYALSGSMLNSEQGRMIALRYHAVKAYIKDLGKVQIGDNLINSNAQVDAMLYAGSRGDSNAMGIFDKLADAAVKQLEQGKIKKFNSKVSEKTLGEEFSADKYRTLFNVSRYESIGSIDDILSNLAIVHERSPMYPFVLGKDGSLTLTPRPNSAFFKSGPDINMETIKNISEQIGVPVEELLTRPNIQESLKGGTARYQFYRQGIHFGINSLVDPIAFAREQQLGEIVVANLKKVIDANPGALENLMPVDTWFTGPLTIPKGSFEILKPSDYESLLNVDQMLMRQISGKRLDAFPGYPAHGVLPEDQQTMAEAIKRHKDNLLRQMIVRMGGVKFSSGTANTTPEQDDLMTYLSRILGVTSQLHSSTGHNIFETIAAGVYDSTAFVNRGFNDISPNMNTLLNMTPKHIESLITNNRSGYIGETTKGKYEGIAALMALMGGGAAGAGAIYNLNNKKMPKFKKGGYVGYANGGAVPAVLHGGEYVLNAKSVAKIGVPQLQAMNAMKFETPNVKYNTPSPQIANYPTGQVSSSTSNVNIYVDNFIGEPEWFKGMMSQYNTKILPGKQKSAGLENRVISTYTGLNGGR